MADHQGRAYREVLNELREEIKKHSTSRAGRKPDYYRQVEQPKPEQQEEQE